MAEKEEEVIPPSMGLNILDLTQAEDSEAPLSFDSNELGTIVDLTETPDLEKTEKELEEIEDKKEEESSKEEEETEEKEETKVEAEAETKEETKTEDEDSEDSEELSAIGEVAKYFGEKGVLSFDEENFEDSEEGFESAIVQTIENKVQNYKDSLSEMSKQYIEYLEDGGRPQDFIEMHSMPDFSQVDPDKMSENENTQKAVVREFLRAQKYSAEEIDEEIQDYEDSGILDKKADRALGKLVRAQEEDKHRFIENQKQEKIRQQQREVETLDNLKKDIESREEIMGFKISKKDQSNFYDYLTKFDRKTGKTQMMTDAENDPDAQLKMAYLYYKGFDFGDIEKKTKTKQARNLKNNLDKFHRDGRNKVKGASKVKKNGEGNINMSMFKQELGV